MHAVVALVGRPNVGKSTLFNRMTRSSAAIVDDIPGVTRDRHQGTVRWDEAAFTLVDTGGFLAQDSDDFAEKIRFQVDQAIAEADALVLILDGKYGLSPFDRELIDRLRPSRKPVYYAVNKIDGPEQEDLLYEFYQLGVDNLFPVSAAHGYGVGDLLTDLVAHLPRPRKSAAQAQAPIRLAVVGRPNVGKSSLINRILGQERLLVSDQPGTTRDAVDVAARIQDREYLFIDTAGIRRKGRVRQKLEKFSVMKALKSLARCDVALIVIDGHEGLTDQDLTVAGYAADRGCACVILINKWDLVAPEEMLPQRFIADVKARAGFLNFAPMLTVSALSGKRVQKIFPMVNQVYDQYATRVETGPLNRILEQATAYNEPSIFRGRRLKFYYITQVRSHPPTFVCFVNRPEGVHFSYKRYLINQLRAGTGLDQIPLRLKFRQRGGRPKT
jgi:GTP-binding protein